MTVLSWLRTVLHWDLGKASAGGLEGGSCPAMGLLSAWKGGNVSVPCFPPKEASLLCQLHKVCDRDSVEW